jgi:hypothetical protein
MITKTMPFAKNTCKQKILAANGCNMQPMFVLLLWGKVLMFNFYCSQFVLTVFPSSSQWVPQHVPNSSSLYLTSFALKFSLLVYPAHRQRFQHIYFGALIYFIFLWWANQRCPSQKITKCTNVVLEPCL